MFFTFWYIVSRKTWQPLRMSALSITMLVKLTGFHWFQRKKIIQDWLIMQGKFPLWPTPLDSSQIGVVLEKLSE
jgi:hypothetical protein